jgi:hypothetical protein
VPRLGKLGQKVVNDLSGRRQAFDRGNKVGTTLVCVGTKTIVSEAVKLEPVELLPTWKYYGKERSHCVFRGENATTLELIVRTI